MKYLTLCIISSVLGLTAAPAAQAADIYTPPPETPQEYAAMGYYLRGDIGWSYLNWDGGENDGAVVAGGGFGYQFNPNMRADIRADWAGDYDAGHGKDVNVTTVLGNLYFDWANESAFTPYVGAGVGYGWADISRGESDEGFAFALMAGVSARLSDTVSIDTEYRFRDVSISGADPMEHQIMTGIRFSF